MTAKGNDSLCILFSKQGGGQSPLSSSGEVTPGQDWVTVIPEQVDVLQQLKTLLDFGGWVCLILPPQ